MTAAGAGGLGAAARTIAAAFVSIVPRYERQEFKDAGTEAGQGFWNGFWDQTESFLTGDGGSDPFTRFYDFAGKFGTAGINAGSAFVDNLNQVLLDQKIEIGEVVQGVEDVFKPVLGIMDSVVENVVGRIPFIGGAALEMTDLFGQALGPIKDYTMALSELGDRWLEVGRVITGQTLDMSQVEDLKDSINDIFSTGLIIRPQDIIDNIGAISTRLNDLSRSDVQDFAITLSQANEILGEININVPQLTGSMNAFGIEGKETIETLNRWVNIVREIGAGDQFNVLLSQLRRIGPSMRELGYDADTTMRTFAAMNESGEDMGRLVWSFTTGTKNILDQVQKGKFEDIRDGWNTIITATREYLALGTQAGRQNALDMLGDFFNARGAPVALEAIEKRILLLPSEAQKAMDEAGDKLNRPIEADVEASASLVEQFRAIQLQIQSSFNDLAGTFSAGLTEYTAGFTDWLTENRGTVVEWAGEITTIALNGLGMFVDATSSLLKGMAPFIQVIKEMVVEVFQWLGSSINFFILGPLSALEGVAAKLGINITDGALKALHDGMTTSLNALQQLDDFNLGNLMRNMGEAGQYFSREVLPGVVGKIEAGVGETLQSIKIEEALTIPGVGRDGKLGVAIDSERSSYGFVDPETGLIKDRSLYLKGKEADWEEIKKRLSEQDIQLEFDKQTGLITKLTTTNQQLADDLDKILKKYTDKQSSAYPHSPDEPVRVPIMPSLEDQADGDYSDLLLPDEMAPASWEKRPDGTLVIPAAMTVSEDSFSQDEQDLMDAIGIPTDLQGSDGVVIPVSFQMPAGGANFNFASMYGGGGLPNINMAALNPKNVSLDGLQPQSVAALAAIQGQFPDAVLTSGFRAHDPYEWHPGGRGLDLAFPMTAEGKARGDMVNAWILANKEMLGVHGTLWQVADHFDHIHVSIKEGISPLLQIGGLPGMPGMAGGGGGFPPVMNASNVQGGGGLQAMLVSRLRAAGLSEDMIRGIVAMNQVESGGKAEGFLGFTRSQAATPELAVQKFLTEQWFPRTASGVPGVTADGRVADWDAFMNFIRVRIVGQTGVVDWQGNQQPPAAEYQRRLMEALGRTGLPQVSADVALTSSSSDLSDYLYGKSIASGINADYLYGKAGAGGSELFGGGGDFGTSGGTGFNSFVLPSEFGNGSFTDKLGKLGSKIFSGSFWLNKLFGVDTTTDKWQQKMSVPILDQVNGLANTVMEGLGGRIKNFNDLAEQFSDEKTASSWEDLTNIAALPDFAELGKAVGNSDLFIGDRIAAAVAGGMAIVPGLRGKPGIKQAEDAIAQQLSRINAERAAGREVVRPEFPANMPMMKNPNDPGGGEVLEVTDEEFFAYQEAYDKLLQSYTRPNGRAAKNSAAGRAEIKAAKDHLDAVDAVIRERVARREQLAVLEQQMRSLEEQFKQASTDEVKIALLDRMEKIDAEIKRSTAVELEPPGRLEIQKAYIEDAKAQGRYKGGGFDKLVERDFQAFIEEQYVALENATKGYWWKAGAMEGKLDVTSPGGGRYRGNLPNPVARSGGDWRTLFRLSQDDLEKYASQEVLDYFSTNQRVTLDQFKANILTEWGQYLSREVPSNYTPDMSLSGAGKELVHVPGLGSAGIPDETWNVVNFANELAKMGQPAMAARMLTSIASRIPDFIPPGMRDMTWPQVMDEFGKRGMLRPEEWPATRFPGNDANYNLDLASQYLFPDEAQSMAKRVLDEYGPFWEGNDAQRAAMKDKIAADMARVEREKAAAASAQGTSGDKTFVAGDYIGALEDRLGQLMVSPRSVTGETWEATAALQDALDSLYKMKELEAAGADSSAAFAEATEALKDAEAAGAFNYTKFGPDDPNMPPPWREMPKTPEEIWASRRPNYQRSQFGMPGIKVGNTRTDAKGELYDITTGESLDRPGWFFDPKTGEFSQRTQSGGGGGGNPPPPGGGGAAAAASEPEPKPPGKELRRSNWIGDDGTLNIEDYFVVWDDEVSKATLRDAFSRMGAKFNGKDMRQLAAILATAGIIGSADAYLGLGEEREPIPPPINPFLPVDVLSPPFPIDVLNTPPGSGGGGSADEGGGGSSGGSGGGATSDSGGGSAGSDDEEEDKTSKDPHAGSGAAPGPPVSPVPGASPGIPKPGDAAAAMPPVLVPGLVPGTGAPGMTVPGGPMPKPANTPYGDTTVYDPYTNLPPWPLTPEQYQDWKYDWDSRVQRDKERNRRIGDYDKQIEEAEADLARVRKEWEEQKKILDQMRSVAEAAGPEAVAALEARRGYRKVADKEQQLREQLKDAEDRAAKLRQSKEDALAQQSLDSEKPFPKPPGSDKAGKVDSDKNAESLGRGLVQGVLEALGFDGSLFSNPLEWGITKLLTGGTSYGLNVLKNLDPAAAGRGGAMGGAAAAGGGGSIGGSIIEGVLPGISSLFQPSAAAGATMPTPASSVTAATARSDDPGVLPVAPASYSTTNNFVAQGLTDPKGMMETAYNTWIPQKTRATEMVGGGGVPA